MLKLPDPRLHLVYDEKDEVKTAALLNRLADPAGGCVVVDVTPDGRNLDWLAVDIERGLGKNPHLSGAGRNTSDRWSRIHAWLIGGQAKTMIVSRIHLLDERRLTSAISLAVTCGVDLWLIAQQKPLPQGIGEALEEWPFAEVDLRTFRRRWPRTALPRPATEAPAEEDEFPAVPLDEFVLFRAACRELLPSEEFAVVDVTFHAAAASTIAWIDASDVISEDTVLKLVGDLIGPSRSLAEAITQLRAAQVAFFWRRYLLKVNLDCVLAAYAIAEQSALDELTIAKLGSYGAARYPAAAVIALGCGLSPEQIALLNLGDISLETNGILICARWSLPPEATALVLAHLVERLLDGASADDPLFVVHTTDKAKRDQRVTDRAIERLLLHILKETGVRITHARSYTGLRGSGSNWRWRESVYPASRALLRGRMSASDALIDGNQVAELRRLAGLSQRALARLLGVAPMSTRRIEEGGGHSDLTLGFVARLAEALGVDLVALLPTAQTLPAAPDDAAVEAALGELGRYVPVEELARALGWTLERTNEALAALEERLKTTGTILKRKRFEYMLRPRLSSLNEEQHSNLQRVALNRWGLHLGTARVLRDAVDDAVDGDWERNAPAWKTLALGALLKHGLVRIERQHAVVDDHVRYSLEISGVATTARKGGKVRRTHTRR